MNLIPRSPPSGSVQSFDLFLRLSLTAFLLAGCDEAADPFDSGHVIAEADTDGFNDPAGIDYGGEPEPLGGSTTDAPETAQPDPENLGDGPAESSAIVAMLELENDVTVEFIDTGDGTVGVLVGGPVGAAEVEAVATHATYSASPLELYSALSSLAVDASEPADAFVDLSAAVVAAGNWGVPKKKVPAPAPASVTGLSGSPSASVQHEGGADTLFSKPHPQSAPCDYLSAHGDKLPGNAGNCTLYYRDDEETTSWWYDDIVAFAGHVIVVDGTLVVWEVKHRNCNVSGCNWHQDYIKGIQEGYHYYYWRTDQNNDHRTQSTVTSYSNGGAHYHDVARIHDWYHRVIWTSYWDQAHWFTYNGTRLYCTDTPYEGPDPNNIATSGSWEGFNELDC